MKILVTGAQGFIGRNLTLILKSRNHKVFEFDFDTPKEQLFSFVSEADFIVHLAGANRPTNPNDVYTVNSGLTLELINLVISSNNKCPIIFSSSIQATLNNDYGRSKKMAEDLFFQLQKDHENKTYVFRLSNLFGKWAKPNYNSVVATFCFNISRGLPLQINDPQKRIPLIYIDDLVNEFVSLIEGEKNIDSTQTLEVTPIYQITLEKLAELLVSFKKIRNTLFLPETGDPFIRKLYATYLTFLDSDDFSYELKTWYDERGSFAEIFKTAINGQISVNVTEPGISKGNHYHILKNEKFLVVSGEAEIRFRKIDSEKITSYKVFGSKLTMVDVPPGYTHSISNIGDTNLVTIIWASEHFDENRPDTYNLDV